MNKALLIAAVALVFATSLVIISSVAIQPAEADGSACPNKSGAAVPVDPNSPNAVNTQTLQLAAEPTV
jgi:hypothetical protein